MEYARLEPFGPVQEDLRAGYLASITHNVNATRGKRLGPEDFFPSLRDMHSKKSVGDMRLMAQAWAASCKALARPEPLRRQTG